MTTLQNFIRNWVFKGRYDRRNSPDNKRKWWRLFWLSQIILLILLMNNTKLLSTIEILTPPKLPALQVVNNPNSAHRSEWLQQYRFDQYKQPEGENTSTSSNNSGYLYDSKSSDDSESMSNSRPSEDTIKYHHLSQGSTKLPIPYDWFIHLEQADASLWSFLFNTLFFRNQNNFTDNRYLLRLGFIRSNKHPKYNPDGLPVGFAKTPSANLAGFGNLTAGIGFTCAACHTGHFIHENLDDGKKTEFVVEGAAASVDLALFKSALAATLGQTVLSSKIPIFDGRFDRFARKVLGSEFSETGKLRLANKLQSIIEANASQGDIIDVTEGFTRLDALNRIGNQVFSEDIDMPKNYHVINAPVKFPHLWTSPWFDWVQYDGSIMMPLIRNAGEAMGLAAEVNILQTEKDNRFDSSIPVKNLFWMEKFLAGEYPLEKKEFSGLLSPSWDESALGSIDQALAAEGRTLYVERCQSCHLPTLDDQEIWDKFEHIEWEQNGETKKTLEKALHMNIIKHEHINTDMAQAKVLRDRTVDTASYINRTVGTASNISGEGNRKEGLGIDTVICGHDPNEIENPPGQLTDVAVKDSGKSNFGFALSAIVQQTIGTWFEEKGITDKDVQHELEGKRPNCIQAGAGYKARPLNGVWATAPFLHNGSVASLRDLLCKDIGHRPEYVELGNILFDSINIGIAQPEGFKEQAKEYLSRGKQYTDEGFFILDTNIEGNRNTGHYFSKHFAEENPKQTSGVIGQKFTDNQCNAMLEYLKTL